MICRPAQNNNNNNNVNTNTSQFKTSKMVKTDKTVTRKSRRKRERDRHKKSTSSEDDRPRTATLKRPFILDETLKDKVSPSKKIKKSLFSSLRHYTKRSYWLMINEIHY